MSDNERLITQPPKARYLSIPHEYFAICQRKKEITITRGERKGEKETTYQTDEVAAALLHFFERWTIWRIKEHKHVEGSEVWLYFAMDQIQSYEFGGAFGTHRLNSAIDLLMELKFLDRRTNPNKGYDRTYQYRFMQGSIQEAVNKLPPFSNIEEWKIQKRIMHSSKPENALSNIEEAIPHDPKHDPTDQEPTTNAKSALVPPPQSAPDAGRFPAGTIGFDEMLDRLDLTQAEIDAAPLDAIIPDPVEVDPVGEYVRDMATVDDPPKPKRKRSDKQLALDAMKNALADAFGLVREKVTSTKWGEFNKAGKELLEVGATPEDMKPLHRWCALKEWENFSSMAMAKEYAAFDKQRQPTTDTAVPKVAFIHDPGCPTCNFGMVVNADGNSAQCPRCAASKEKEAV